jgi:hypothetical protein
MQTAGPDSPPKISFAFSCGAALAGTVAGAQLFRAALWLIFTDQRERVFSVTRAWTVLAVFLGLIWVALVASAVRYGNRRSQSRPDQTEVKRKSWLIDVPLGTVAALVIAISAWLALEANDELFFSRLLPWIGSLIWIQEPGFRVASRLFPCRYEGFNTGCEAYKWLPAFLLANVAAYVPFSTPALSLQRRSARFRERVSKVHSPVLRWSVAIGITGLCFRRILHGLAPDVSLPFSSWKAGHIAWLVLNEGTGVICTVLALSFPFYLYRTLRAVRRGTGIRASMVDATWAASFLLVAIVLGNL